MNNPLQFNLVLHKDNRGSLYVLDQINTSFFYPKRVFFLTQIPTGISRGKHGHFECKQIIIALNGKIEIIWKNSDSSGIVQLDEFQALFVPEGNWIEISSDKITTIAMVVASEFFDSKDYFTREPI